MKRKYWLSLLISITQLFLICKTALAQKDADLVAEADITYGAGAKLLALEQYELALQQNPSNVRANFMAGKCIIETIEKGRASKYFIKAYELDPKISPDVLFLIGQSFQFGKEFDKATEYYEKYKAKLNEGGAKPDSKTAALLEEKLYQCANGKKFMKDPLEYSIIDLGAEINSPEADYGPAVNRNETLLIFTSRRPGGTGIGNVDKDLEFFEDIYVSEFKNGKWQPAQNIGTNINTEFHDASIGLSPDGKQLYVYRDDNGTGDIFVCDKKKDGTWSEPEPMDANINTKYNESSISVSPDGRTLFFTSDKPGGKGGMDIYVSKADKNGRWGIATNIGGPINTKSDEEGPFIDYDGKTLYFSSKSHAGMGGYDIFVSEFDSASNKWMEPINIGYPINTPDDDIFFVKSGDSKFGYYASVKDGGLGEKDIYRVAIPDNIKTYKSLKNRSNLVAKNEEVPPVTNELEVPKVDDTTAVASNEPIKTTTKPKTKPTAVKEKVPTQPVVLTIRITDENDKPIDAKLAVNGKADNVEAGVQRIGEGTYQCTFQNAKAKTYTISVEKEAYMFRSESVIIPKTAAQAQELTRDIQLSMLTVGIKTVLRNIYFAPGKATFTNSSYTELNKLTRLLQDNSSFKIQISGHTDRIGDNASNKVLSQRRADAVIRFLAGKGIDTRRLVSRGYGEERPLASNDDEREGRELNRRTEFEILSK